MSTSLKTLISKLNNTCRQAAERAASLCMARGHFEVDLEHFMLALLEQPQTDLAVLCQRFDVSVTALQREAVQGCTLHSQRPSRESRLGWDTFLQTRPAAHDRSDVHYDIHAAA